MKDYRLSVVYQSEWQAFDKLLYFFSIGKPFDVLDNRERQILACIYAGMGIEDTCDVLDIKKGHYGVKVTSLRKKQMIDGNKKPKYAITKPSTLLFAFVCDKAQDSDTV